MRTTSAVGLRKRLRLDPGVRSVHFAVAVAVVAAAAGGCGGDTTTVKDMTVRPPDLAVPPPDLGMLTEGTRLAPGDWALTGVTADDHAVLLENTKGGVWVASAAGGAPTAVSATASVSYVYGKSVWAAADLDEQTGIGTVSVWTAASKAKEISAKGLYGLGITSDDSQYILYALAADNDGTAADLYLARADGSGAKLLWSRLPVDTNCGPRMAFAGSRAVVVRCDPPGDGGSAMGATLSTVESATGAIKDLRRDLAPAFALDKDGTRAVVVTTEADAYVVPLGGGAATKLDGTVASWFVVPDGGRVIYRSSDKMLKSVATTNPMPQVLVDTGTVSRLRAISRDYKFLMFANKSVSTANSDLFLASTEKAGKPVTLSAATSGTIYGDAFTADSSQALYITMANAQYIGVLNALPVDGSAMMPRVVGRKVWVAYSGRGTQVVYNDNFKPAGMTVGGRADLFITDVATQDPPVLLATQADADFFITDDGSRVFYTYHAAASATGLYLADLP